MMRKNESRGGRCRVHDKANAGRVRKQVCQREGKGRFFIAVRLLYATRDYETSDR